MTKKVVTGILEPAATYPAIVGQVLADARKNLRLSQGELARKIGMNQSAWSKIERGASSLSVAQLALAATALKTTPGKLLTQADRSANYAAKRGVRVAPQTKTDDLIAAGLVIIGTAALAGLIAAALSGGEDTTRSK